LRFKICTRGCDVTVSRANTVSRLKLEAARLGAHDPKFVGVRKRLVNGLGAPEGVVQVRRVHSLQLRIPSCRPNVARCRVDLNVTRRARDNCDEVFGVRISRVVGGDRRAVDARPPGVPVTDDSGLLMTNGDYPWCLIAVHCGEVGLHPRQLRGHLLGAQRRRDVLCAEENVVNEIKV